MTTVKLFTAPMCSQCIRVKEFLNFIDVSYEEINIEENPEAKSKLEDIADEPEAPVLSIKNDVVEGFDRELIIEVLEQNEIEVDNTPTSR